MHPVSGSCSCGGIEVLMQLSRPPGEFAPRRCDCDYCALHGAAYVSDAHGSLSIRVHRPEHRVIERQGSELAEFLLCRRCGMLIGVLHHEGGHLFGAINAGIAAKGTNFGPAIAVSPKRLDADGKRRRWREVWFPDVLVVEGRPQ
jgi:hypothetical protein